MWNDVTRSHFFFLHSTSCLFFHMTSFTFVIYFPCCLPTKVSTLRCFSMIKQIITSTNAKIFSTTDPSIHIRRETPRARDLKVSWLNNVFWHRRPRIGSYVNFIFMYGNEHFPYIFSLFNLSRSRHRHQGAVVCEVRISIRHCMNLKCLHKVFLEKYLWASKIHIETRLWLSQFLNFFGDNTSSNPWRHRYFSSVKKLFTPRKERDFTLHKVCNKVPTKQQKKQTSLQDFLTLKKETRGRWNSLCITRAEEWWCFFEFPIRICFLQKRASSSWLTTTDIEWSDVSLVFFEVVSEISKI